jgi:hypothetical protein
MTSKRTRIAALVIGALLLFAGLALFVMRAPYQPAITARPDAVLRWVNAPSGRLDAIARSLQAMAEQRPVVYEPLGWADNQRFAYRERHDARFDRSGAWHEGAPGPFLVYDLESGTSSPWAGALEDLVVQPCAMSDCVAPLTERFYAGSGWLYLPGNYNAVLSSPDGRWVALVVRHIYGPEDLVVVGSAELPSLPRDGNSGARTNPSVTS